MAISGNWGLSITTFLSNNFVVWEKRCTTDYVAAIRPTVCWCEDELLCSFSGIIHSSQIG